MNLANARSSGSLHRQVRRMLVQCITIVLLLAMSVCLGIELHQEVRTRDQLLSNAAQMAADAPLLTDDIQADGVQQYLARTVQHVSEVDMLGVYDMGGKPTAFYYLASGAGDVSVLPAMRADRGFFCVAKRLPMTMLASCVSATRIISYIYAAECCPSASNWIA